MKFKIRNNKGTSVVEMALVLPLLLMLVFGIIEFGLLLYNKAVITNASREGARYGIQQAPPGERPDLGAIQVEVNRYFQRNPLVTFASSPVPPTITALGVPCANFGDNLTVEVTYHYEFLVIPNFVTSLIDGLDINADTLMKCE